MDVVSCGSRRGSGNESKSNGLAICVGTVEFADRGASIMDGCVSHESSARGAAGSVKAERKGRNRANTIEEVLVAP